MRSVVVIGAGAAGMTAAVSAARHGAKVTLIEKNRKPGVKLRLTGSGRCNLTNMDQDPRHYHGADASFTSAVFDTFGLDDTLDFFKELGLLTREKDGYVYPLSNRAESVEEVLSCELDRLGVKTVFNTRVMNAYQELIYDEEGDPDKVISRRFHVVTDGWTYEADALVLAAGSAAAPRTGSTGDGYRLAEGFGHGVVKPLPALVPLRCEESFMSALAGVRVQADVSIHADGERVAFDTGEVQFNADGISGIPVLQVSRAAATALDEGKHVEAVLKLIPRGMVPDGSSGEREEADTLSFLRELSARNGRRTGKKFLAGIFPPKMTERLLAGAGIAASQEAGKWTDAQLERLSGEIDAFRLRISATAGFAAAQACQGGVDLRETDPLTMQSEYIPGLYFAGETLDVDGDCGGYNLQWAWSSGFLAGMSAAKG